uniref:Uncharacterized protein n=1 Tax=Oryza brachyantha TaxID=4533 RepID=J3N7F5_ORYBR
MSKENAPSNNQGPTSGTEPMVNQPSATPFDTTGVESMKNPPSSPHKEAMSSLESWRTSIDPFQLELVQTALERLEDDLDYIPIEQAIRPKSSISNEHLYEWGTPKKQRGERSRNQLPKETYYIAALNDDGKPVEPLHVMIKFSRGCGTLARLLGPLNVDEWKDVNMHLKNLMWDELQKKTRLLLSKTPFEKYGSIMQIEWDKFVTRMTTPEAIARRKKMGQVDMTLMWPNGAL